MCYCVTTYKVMCTEFLSIAVPYEKHKLNNVDSLMDQYCRYKNHRLPKHLKRYNIYGKTRIIGVFFKNKVLVKRAHT